MPWHLDAISLGHIGNRSVQETGHGVVVAMVDTGVSHLHHESTFAPDAVFAAYVLEQDPSGGYVVVQVEPGEPGTYPPVRKLDHGTAVAGLICDEGVGVAPEARLISVALPLRPSHRPTTGRLWGEALFAALEHLRRIAGFQILNLSLAMPATAMPLEVADRCRAILREMVEHGIVVVAAVGNVDERMTAPGAPGLWPEVIAVGGTGRDHQPWSESLAGHRPGDGIPLPHVHAPGHDVYACRAAGDDRASGTSFACPIVSATVALMRERNSGVSVDDVRAALLAPPPLAPCVLHVPLALQAV